MKKNILIITAILASLLIGGCQEALDYTDVILFTGTEGSAEKSMYVDGIAETSVSITSSAKMVQDVDIYIDIDMDALNEFSKSKGATYAMIPLNSYLLSDTATTIEAGQNISAPIKLEITDMSDFEEGVNYCIPFKITGNSQGLDVLEASRYQFIIIKPVLETRGANLNNSWRVEMQSMKDDPALDKLPACTMELRIYANGWRTSGDMISTLMGVEENFLLRVGDIGIKEYDKLQLAGRGTSITAPTKLALKQWYHIAVVDNGSEMTIYIDGNPEITVDSSKSKDINLGFYYNSYFSVGHSVDSRRYFNGWVSEARVWRRALTPIELTNNQCYVDVDSAEGLIGYWRLNEADGRMFEDLSGNEYHGTASSNPIWTETFKCPILK